MTYRKIMVLGREYVYSVGRTHTKIRLGDKSEVFPNAQIGSPLGDSFRVTPANVANAIQRLSRPVFTCKAHGYSTHRLTIDPYSSELYGKKNHMIDCPKCVAQAEGDI